MADEKRPPASQDKVPVVNEDRERSPKRQQTYPEQMAELNIQAFNIEVARRTGLSVEKAGDIVDRLRDKGDFFTDEGRWTLDVAGYPVLHKGWKEEKIEPL